jgi:hypothetical protein
MLKSNTQPGLVTCQVNKLSQAALSHFPVILPPVRVNPEGHVLPVLSKPGPDAGSQENGDAAQVVTLEKRKLTLGDMPWAATVGFYKG